MTAYAHDPSGAYDATQPGVFRSVGDRLRNWGRWGDEDCQGTLNLITDLHRAAAAASVRSGRVVPLGLPFDEHGPQGTHSERENVVHIMTRTGDVAPTASGYVFTDDLVTLYLQAGTQIDGLAHVGYDGLCYDGVPLTDIDTEGAHRLGIEAMAAGIQTRGVLLDIARHLGMTVLPGGFIIEPNLLDECATAQGVTITPGDAVLIRTGWLGRFIDDRDGAAFLAGEPGLGLACADWVAAHEVAFLAADNFGIEVVPSQSGDDFPLHCVLIRDMGMPLGEMLVLDGLAARCEVEQRWDFFFACAPLPIVGAVGSPVAPVAIF